MDKDAIRKETLPLMVLIDAGNVIERALEKRLLGLNLSVAQQRILTHVYSAEGKLTPGFLGGLLLQEPHSISGLLNRLEDRELVTRSRDRRDRRVVWVGLTEEGREIAKKAIEIVVQVSKDLSPYFADRKGQGALELVTRVRDHGIGLSGLHEEARDEALRVLSEPSLPRS
jgi:DNA-binding MarR family transcriptional regulator